MALFRHIYIAALLLLAPTIVCAEQLFTTPFAPYEMREDAQSGVRKQQEYYRDFAPKLLCSTPEGRVFRQLFMVPASWSDRVVLLHAEGVGSAYDIVINDQKVISQEDAITPTNIEITKYLLTGVNRIDFSLRKSQVPQIDQGVNSTKSNPFEGSYIVAQPHLHIEDFSVSIHPDSTKKRGVLDIEVILRNNFSQGQSVDVGYDIYSPEGKLLDYSVSPFEVRGADTLAVRFSPTVIGAFDNKWSTTSPKQYRVMLYTRRRGIITEYIPLKVGFLDIAYDGTKLYNFGDKLSLNIRPYNAPSLKEQSRKELLQLKREGVNTIAPPYPQAMWLYELCNELGMWIIERININATKSPTDKRVGGTPANDPTLLEEYIRRAEGAYARSRNMGCVIGYSLGGDESGNGYNMYKLYEWMKGVEPNRPIIYKGARGEWNSDTIE